MRAGDPTRLGSQGIPKVYRSAFVAVKIPQALLCCVTEAQGRDRKRWGERTIRFRYQATVLCKAYRGGHLTIRLALGGCTNRPFYRIVAAHNKCPRDGRFVEQLGSYDPMPNSHGEKLVALNLDRIRHWIGCGAHLSKPVEKLLGLSGFFPLHPMVITNAERLRRKRAREVLLAQKPDTEATETKES